MKNTRQPFHSQMCIVYCDDTCLLKVKIDKYTGEKEEITEEKEEQFEVAKAEVSVSRGR